VITYQIKPKKSKNTKIIHVSLSGDSQFKLPPHVDGGGLERWSDPNYRQVYRKIYENFEDYDPFEVDYRTQANMNELGIANGCTFFRYVNRGKSAAWHV
jgi:hypothetical protein